MSLLLPGPASGEQPMDRLERLIESGKASEAEAAARRWLERNDGDRRRTIVSALLAEAAWFVAAEEPTIPGVRAWREEFGGTSPRSQQAFALEGNLAYYAALRTPSEAGFRAVVDDYSGTPASLEADVAAANQGLVEARDAGSIDSLSGWLSRYPSHPEREAVHSALHEAVWVRAEAEGTTSAWLDLRASFPRHPRSMEAREREATAALGEVGSEASPAQLMRLGTRYGGTEAARFAWRRALRLGELTTRRVARTS